MSMLVLVLVGAVLGFATLGVGGAVAGAVIGALAARGNELGARLLALEGRLTSLEERGAAPAAEQTAEPARAARKAEPIRPAYVYEREEVAESARPEAARVAAPTPPPAAPAAPAADAPRHASAPPKAEPAARSPRARAERAAQSADSRPGAFDQSIEAAILYVKRWFTTGNVPVKVGVVLSVFGVGFLIKEGIDRHVLVLPIEIRLALVALFGIVLLAIGWRLRHKQRTYALSVQGGGVAVLYLTTYAAFAQFNVLPAPAAFAALVIVTAAAGTLAVLQDSRALAVLGIVGGFLAPVLTSTNSGNHVALFSYYAILNFAILGIAWFKAWRALNVLGFVFTFGIGGLWGYDAYRPELFATTEPFLVLFVLLYVLIPVLFATRQAPNLRGFVDGTLLFGTPVVGFGLQSQLLADTQYGLAISAVALAAVYVLLATYLFRRRVPELRVLIEAQLALAVAFVTVAVPLALDARWTSAAWALQGAAMVWLGFRQGRKLALAAGVALQLLSAGAYLEQPAAVAEWPVLNGYCLGALLLALAGWFSGRLFEPDAARPEELRVPSKIAAALFLAWGSGWWLYGGFAEIDRHVNVYGVDLAVDLVFIAGTTLLAMLAAQRFAWPRLNVLGLVAWPAAFIGAPVALLSAGHPTAYFGWIAWPVLWASMFVFLRGREQQFGRLAAVLHAVACWTIAGLLAAEAHWQVARFASGIWPDAAALATGGALVLATLNARDVVAWPVRAHALTYVKLGSGGVLAVLVLATLIANVASPGDALPLEYVPLLNPLEIASAFVFIALLRWLSALEREQPALALAPRHRAALAGGFGLFLLTMMVARTVHHWTGVPFDADSLVASTTLQAALSMVWGATGLAAMTLGARQRQRVLWLVGAALMTVVVAKLILVDLGNAGTLGRVVSFLGVGVLLLVVGYFAPVPPRAEPEGRAA